VWNWRGDIALQRGFIDKALTAYSNAGNTEKIAQLNGNQPLIEPGSELESEAEALMQAEAWPEAVATYEKLLGVTQDAEQRASFQKSLSQCLEEVQGQPLGGGTVNFSVVGPGILSTTNPVLADPQGFVQTTVSANALAGGVITVTASTPGSQTNGEFSLFSRKLSTTKVTNLLIVSITNQTTAVPAQVPYIVMMSLPGSPVLPTIVGPLCVDPGYALAIVIEDGLGFLGGVSFSGTGAIGTPGKTWLYQGLPPGLFAGTTMSFQLIGFDPVTGWFRSNCELEQF
jgi:hypothetical protein